MEQLTIPLQIKPELNIFKIDLDNYSSVKSQLEKCFETIGYKFEDSSLILTYVQSGVQISFTTTNRILDKVYSLIEIYSEPYFYLLFITKHNGDIHIGARNSVYSSEISRLMKRLNYDLTEYDLAQIGLFNG